MDYRCPSCGKDLASRKRIAAIITRMELDCPHCRRRIRLNLHPLEVRIVLAGFVAFVALAGLGYALRSNALSVIALVAGMTGPSLLPVVERVWIRNWARYVLVERRSDGGEP